MWQAAILQLITQAAACKRFTNRLVVYKIPGLNKAAAAYGVSLLYLPPYSLDFNLVELGHEDN